MIQIYTNGNENYTKNGDYVIFPESCVLLMELNGPWTVELHHPRTKKGLIAEEDVLKVPTPYGDKLFRIYEVTKDPMGITAYARPIFLDAAHEVFITSKKPRTKTPQQVMDALMSGTRYSGQSNIERATSANFECKNLIACISGDDANSILNRWGGEILYDDYKIIINDRIGGDYGAQAIGGLNIAEIEETISMDEIVTRIYPKAYNGYTLTGTKYVDSPLINAYRIVYAKEIVYDDVKLQSDCQEEEQGFATLSELREELIRRAQDDFAEGIDKPTIEMNINMIDLARRKEYRAFTDLEKVRLGDTVHVNHRKLDIKLTARAISLEYDCVRKKNGNVVLGSYQYRYFQNLDYVAGMMQNIIRTDGSVMADRVSGIINLATTQLQAQRDVTNRMEYRSILFEDLDSDSPLYGALAIGTQGIEIAKTRTADGQGWEWTTAITCNGVIADSVLTGLLSDKNAQNYWNLDTGEFVLSSDTKVGGKTISELLDTGKNLAPEGKDFPSSSSAWKYVNCKRTSDEDPEGGNGAVWCYPSSTDAYIRTDTDCHPIDSIGTYTFTFWAKANGTYKGFAINFGNTATTIDLSAKWKKYTITTTVNTEEDLPTNPNDIYIGYGTFGTDIKTMGNVLKISMYDPVITKTFSQDHILNIITRNGEDRGIYRIDGKLYISLDALLGGTVKLGGKDNGDGSLYVYDASGKLVSKIDNEGFDIKKGKLNITATGQQYIDYNFLRLIGTGYDIGAATKDVIVRADEIIFTAGYDKGRYSASVLDIGSGASNYVHLAAVMGGLIMSNGLAQIGELVVKGSKARVVDVLGENRLLYAYETPTPYFGDIGTAETDEAGISLVSIDFDFRETIEKTEYNVFLQPEGEGQLYVAEKNDDYFVVKGTQNLKYSWHLFCPQRDYSMYRLDENRDRVDYEDNYKEGLDLEEIPFDEDPDLEGIEVI